MIDTNQMVQDVMDGNENPFKALYTLKNLQKEIKIQIEVVEVEAFNQSIYEGKKFIKDGFEIEKRNGRKTWNFKGCESFVKKNDELEQLKNDLKQNFSLYEKGKSSIDEDGVIGEVPKVTYAKDSMIIKKL